MDVREGFPKKIGLSHSEEVVDNTGVVQRVYGCSSELKSAGVPHSLWVTILHIVAKESHIVYAACGVYATSGQYSCQSAYSQRRSEMRTYMTPHWLNAALKSSGVKTVSTRMVRWTRSGIMLTLDGRWNRGGGMRVQDKHDGTDGVRYIWREEGKRVRIEATGDREG